jgi:hypothetical protein
MNSPLLGKNLTRKHQDILAAIGLAVVALLLFRNARYGIGNEDQSLYLSITLRLTMGESLLTDDWTMIQLSSFLLYLPVKAYLAVFGSTDGIVLFFRYLFIVMQGATATAIYCLLKKYGIFSIFAALIFFSYIPVTIMALSYYSMGLVFVELSGLTLLTATKFSRIRFIITGLFIAGAVLCNPLYALIYFAFTVCVIVYNRSKKNRERFFTFSGQAFQKKTWIWIAFGIGSLTALFVLFVFSRTGIKEIAENLPYIFKDPDYVFSGEQQNVISMKDSFLSIANFGYHLVVIYAIMMIALLIDKKRVAHRPVYLSVVILIYIVLMLHIIRSSVVSVFSDIMAGKASLYYEIPTLALMLPLTLLGLACYLLSKTKDKGVFVFLWLHGILFTVCMDITSDFAPWNSMLGLAVSGTGSVLLIKNMTDELAEETNKQIKYKTIEIKNKELKYRVEARMSQIVSTALLFALAFQVFTNLYVASDFKSLNFAEYLNKPASEKLEKTIHAGPLKGLRTTAYMDTKYNEILNDLSEIKAKNDGPVLIISNRPWCYVYLNMPFATFSVNLVDWSHAGNVRLPQYYQLHPEKTPKYIYVSKLAEWSYESGPQLDERAEYFLEDISKKYNCIVKETAVGYILEVVTV